VDSLMAVTVKIANRPAGWKRQSYLWGAMQGMGVTFRHLLRNWPRNLLGRRAQSDIVTLSYPEEKRPYPPRNRGLHRLMKRADGQVRCVACMMCPTACPAHCISIVPEESEDPRIEKRPRIFQIDELRCVVCGLCVEACPCDAIRMDTGIHAPPATRRADAILDKEELLSRGEISVAAQAGEGLFWREKK
jgi:NADH-quinone oxidoreductase subunit I